MAPPRVGIPKQATKLFPERHEQPFDLFLVSDTLDQFDSKYVQGLTAYNINLFHVTPEHAHEITKTRRLRGIVSVPELNSGNGFQLLTGLRETVGKNTPLLVFSPLFAAA